MAFEIISRSEWNAKHGDGAGNRPLPASEAWLHHSVTVAPDVKWPISDDYAAIKTIERIGAERFGSTYGFPYTFAITPIGLCFEGHKVGQQGAHTQGHNYQGIGIVFVGNFEEDEPTREMIMTTARLLVYLKKKNWLKRARLTGGHRDTKQTACPGKYAYAAIKEINSLAAALENGRPIGSPKDWWEMAIPDADLNRIAAAVWGEQLLDPGDKKMKTAKMMMGYNYTRVNRVVNALGVQARALKAVADKVGAGDKALGTQLTEVAKDIDLIIEELNEDDPEVPEPPQPL